MKMRRPEFIKHVSLWTLEVLATSLRSPLETKETLLYPTLSLYSENNSDKVLLLD